MLDCLQCGVLPPHSIEAAAHFVCLGDVLLLQLAGSGSQNKAFQKRYRGQAKQAFAAAVRDRTVCLGAAHPLTVFAQRRLDAADR